MGVCYYDFVVSLLISAADSSIWTFEITFHNVYEVIPVDVITVLPHSSECATVKEQRSLWQASCGAFRRISAATIDASSSQWKSSYAQYIM